MGISSSLYSSISGLNTMGNAMSVIGDNTANVNTVAFKSSRATFQDVLSQSISTAAGSAQVGRGVTLSTVDGVFAQGSFESTSNPTDMAIGGQGFFMLRAGDSSEANMYTRAGEFRFDQEGNLINPVGYFVQGWTIDAKSGQVSGTIGDINLGKNTPPVATQQIEAIVNLDSNKPNETTEKRLYDAWDGTKAWGNNGANPSSPIESGSYEYTSAVKVYDSKGASHDITIYFDRTTNDNEWEFLVTCSPSEDARALTAKEQSMYAPNDRYNYQDPEHTGAGALMYGIINFTTAGDINKISAWNVPPDGRVDISLNDNRKFLEPTDNYYSFGVNFTGDNTNQFIAINLGARYNGVATPQRQVLVSEAGAKSNAGLSEIITKETTWNSVYDAGGQVMADGDTITYSGFNHDGFPVSGTYNVVGTAKLSIFLKQLGDDFGGTATIDSAGRLRLEDNKGGDSGMYVTSFAVTAASGSVPFGGSALGTKIDIASSKTAIVSPGRAFNTNSGAPPVIGSQTTWGSVYSAAGAGPVGIGNTLQFLGTKGDGTAVDVTYIVTDPAHRVQDLLNALEAAFDADASIDSAGRLVLQDWTASETGHPDLLSIGSIVYGGGAPAVFGATATPFSAITGSLEEDGSQEGARVSTTFETEALASTQYANSSTTIFQDQNGYAAGFLQSVSVDTDGIITGHYSNGQVLEKAQVALASFNNMAGLNKKGGNIFTETTESGAPVTGAPGTNGLGSIAPNSLEQSNVDLGTEFVKLITTQRGFQANSKIITTTDEMLADLINIKR
jgi:flagellar hook-basal body protein